MPAREAPPAAPEPLTAEDLAILRLESKTVAGHTLKVMVLRPTHDGPRPDLDSLCARIAARVVRAPRLRKRLEARGRRRAAWVDYPDFDVRDHVRTVAAGQTGLDDTLRHLCGRLMEERLDRSRPLWTMDLVDPRERGDVALVWRLHHSMADGVTAIRLAEDVLWDTADVAEPPDSAEEHPPPLAELREALELRRPGRLPGTLRRELGRSRKPSPLEGVVGRRRAVGFVSVRLAELKRGAKALVPRATVNDVVLALVAAGLRNWSEYHGGPVASMRVKIPVSLHHRGESPATVNRDSFFCVALPLAEPDPVQRLRRINEETVLRKQAGDALVLDTLSRDFARLAPPLRRLLDRRSLHPRAFALNVSNLIGPARRPSVLGCPVSAFYSVADVDRRHGLRVAIISTAGELHFGLCAEPAIVGDMEPLVGGIVAEAASITERAGESLGSDGAP